MRAYFAKMKLDDDTMDILSETMLEMEKQISFKVSDIKKFVKSQVPTETEEVTVVSEKRGRGRPRKEVDVTAVPVMKRGRGRPRKESTETVVPMVSLEAISN